MAPVISAITPNQHPITGGTFVITGTGFSSPTVDLGGTAATVTSWTSTTINCVAPPHSATNAGVYLVVTNAGGASTPTGAISATNRWRWYDWGGPTGPPGQLVFARAGDSDGFGPLQGHLACARWGTSHSVEQARISNMRGTSTESFEIVIIDSSGTDVTASLDGLLTAVLLFTPNSTIAGYYGVYPFALRPCSGYTYEPGAPVTLDQLPRDGTDTARVEVLIEQKRHHADFSLAQTGTYYLIARVSSPGFATVGMVLKFALHDMGIRIDGEAVIQYPGDIVGAFMDQGDQAILNAALAIPVESHSYPDGSAVSYPMSATFRASVQPDPFAPHVGTTSDLLGSGTLQIGSYFDPYPPGTFDSLTSPHVDVVPSGVLGGVTAFTSSPDPITLRSLDVGLTPVADGASLTATFRGTAAAYTPAPASSFNLGMTIKAEVTAAIPTVAPPVANYFGLASLRILARSGGAFFNTAQWWCQGPLAGTAEALQQGGGGGPPSYSGGVHAHNVFTGGAYWRDIAVYALISIPSTFAGPSGTPDCWIGGVVPCGLAAGPVWSAYYGRTISAPLQALAGSGLQVYQGIEDATITHGAYNYLTPPWWSNGDMEGSFPVTPPYVRSEPAYTAPKALTTPQDITGTINTAEPGAIGFNLFDNRGRTFWIRWGGWSTTSPAYTQAGLVQASTTAPFDEWTGSGAISTPRIDFFAVNQRSWPPSQQAVVNAIGLYPYRVSRRSQRIILGSLKVNGGATTPEIPM